MRMVALACLVTGLSPPWLGRWCSLIYCAVCCVRDCGRSHVSLEAHVVVVDLISEWWCFDYWFGCILARFGEHFHIHDDFMYVGMVFLA